MPTSEKKLAVAAMGLPRKKRAKLAGLLLKSLETKKEHGISEAWADEASARARAFRQGKIKALPVEKALGFKL
jgi:putative addiction module component (TIGR02574 family)